MAKKQRGKNTLEMRSILETELNLGVRFLRRGRREANVMEGLLVCDGGCGCGWNAASRIGEGGAPLLEQPVYHQICQIKYLNKIYQYYLCNN